MPQALYQRLNLSPTACYIAPMAIWLAFIWIGSSWNHLYPLSYAARSIIVAIVLYLLWQAYTRIVWSHLSIGVLVGVIGTVQWIGMELVLRKYEFLSWTRFGSEPAFDYINFINTQPAWLYVAFIAIRLLGSALVVPVFEELFWRDWLWRTIAAPNDFRLCRVGEYEKWAFWLTPLFFALVHPQWLLAVIYGFLMNILLLKTKSLGACIVAHGVTNFLLGVYVLVSWHVFEVDQWFFW